MHHTPTVRTTTAATTARVGAMRGPQEAARAAEVHKLIGGSKVKKVSFVASVLDCL